MTDKEKEHMRWLVEKYQFMLARYLNVTAMIEDKIDELITASFNISKDNKWKFINLILSDLPLATKIQKLQKTLKEIQPYLGERFNKDDLANRLEKVRKTRNMFAHSVLNMNPDYLARGNREEIGLLNPRNTQPRQQISLRDWDIMFLDATKVLETLTEYLSTIEKTS